MNCPLFLNTVLCTVGDLYIYIYTDAECVKFESVQCKFLRFASIFLNILCPLHDWSPWNTRIIVYGIYSFPCQAFIGWDLIFYIGLRVRYALGFLYVKIDMLIYPFMVSLKITFQLFPHNKLMLNAILSLMICLKTIHLSYKIKM